MVVKPRKTDQRLLEGCQAQKDIKDFLMVVKHRQTDQRILDGCQAQKDRSKTS